MTSAPNPGPLPEPNLRDRLIEAGMMLLERDGVAGMSLRKTAALAGVSHAAPAHHFDGLPGLMTAIASAAFARFNAAMEAAIAKAPPEPEARLQATCAGYLDFAARHAGLFHVMFQNGQVTRDDPALRVTAAHAYDLLRQACAPFAPDLDQAFETAVWSMVHGYALLGFGAQIGQQRGQLRVPAFSDCLSRLIAENRTRPLARPETGG